MRRTKTKFLGTEFVAKIGIQRMKIESVVHDVDLRIHYVQLGSFRPSLLPFLSRFYNRGAHC
jgi:hypothetical protein